MIKQIICILFVFLVGCAPTRRQCERNYGPCGFVESMHDTTYIKIPVEIGGATVTDTIELERFLLDTMLINVPFVVEDSAHYVQAMYWKDAYGRLFVNCTSKTRVVQADCPQIPQPQKKPPPVECPKCDWWKWFLIGAGCGCGVLVVIRLALK